MHLVMRLHFRSRDKDGSHTIRPMQPHATRRLHCSMFYRTGVIADQSFTLQE